MRKVLVFAYFNKNIGDDLFVKILQDKYKNNYTFLVTSGTDRVQISENFNGNIEYYSKTMEKLDNLLYKKLGYMYFLRKIISKYSDIIIIGGSMFIQYKGWENKYKFYQELINEKTCIIGVNFGPFYDNTFLEKYRSLFEVASLVSFREKKSYDFFSHLKNIQYKPDVVFNLYNEKKVNKKNKIIGISVIDTSQKENIDEGKYMRLIENYIKDYNKKGYEVVLFSFCEPEGDLKICMKIKKIYSYVKVISYTGNNLREFIEEYRKCEKIIATRFHSMILGWIYGCEVLPLAYSDKTINVIKDISSYIEYIDLRKIKPDSIENDVFKKLDIRRLKRLRKESEEHFLNIPKLKRVE